MLDAGKLYLTADGDATWRQAATTSERQLGQVTLVSGQTGWGLSKTGIWRTDDGGQT